MSVGLKERTGKYLAFDLNGERYGIDSMRVVSIIGYQPCTPLPQAPRYVRGLTMIRGKVVPVIDTRLRLGLPEGEETPETCIVLVTVGSGQTGIIVDAVQDVMDLREDQFDHLNDELNGDDMIGVAKVGKNVVTVLAIDAIVKLS